MTLFREIVPFPGESLPGLVARAAGANIYPTAAYVLLQAGLKRMKPEAVAMREPDVASDLARVLGTDRERLVPLFHPANGRGTIDFFGITMRAIHRESYYVASRREA